MYGFIYSVVKALKIVKNLCFNIFSSLLDIAISIISFVVFVYSNYLFVFTQYRGFNLLLMSPLYLLYTLLYPLIELLIELLTFIKPIGFKIYIYFYNKISDIVNLHKKETFLKKISTILTIIFILILLHVIDITGETHG